MLRHVKVDIAYCVFADCLQFSMCWAGQHRARIVAYEQTEQHRSLPCPAALSEPSKSYLDVVNDLSDLSFITSNICIDLPTYLCKSISNLTHNTDNDMTTWHTGYRWCVHTANNCYIQQDWKIVWMEWKYLLMILYLDIYSYRNVLFQR